MSDIAGHTARIAVSAEHGNPSFTQRRCAAFAVALPVKPTSNPTCAITSARFGLYPDNVGIGTDATSIISS